MWGMILLHKCDFVNPEYNFQCHKKSDTKIVVNMPNKKDPIVLFACKEHGDSRFNWLSATEIKITKAKDTNKISYTEYSEAMKQIRWKKCRRCNGEFVDSDMQCLIEYLWLKDNKISLRRSFSVHIDCLTSELRFYEVQEYTGHRETTLDQMI